MSTVRSAIELQDNFSNVLFQVIDSVNLGLAAMEELNQAMNNPVDTSTFDAARDSAIQASAALTEYGNNAQEQIGRGAQAQREMNQEMTRGADSAGNLKRMIAGAVGAYTGIAGIRKAFSFVQDCTEAFNTQLNAENQLMIVLGNMLDEDYVAQFALDTSADTTAAVDEINAIQNTVGEVAVPVTAESKALQAEFDAIKEKAAEIQSNGIYGDEAMIAGAAEFATYFSDTDAITTMMDTLADYAMGMTGGGEIDSTAMVDYATNLGKIMSGSYDAMTKKGFEFSDAQKAVLEGTATQEQLVSVLGEDYASMSEEMQAAAAISQVIEESWGGLYESMSDTPEGKIIQLKNAWGDMKEVIGGQLYPYVLLFVDAISSNWGTIEGIVTGITVGLEYLMGVLSWLLEGAIGFAQVVMDNWSWISPIIYGIIGALAVYGAYLAITKGIELAKVAVKGIMAVAEGIHAAAIWATTSATWAEVTAQNGLNSAMYACPIVWIIILIIALIALFYAVIGIINKIAGTSISATGIICGVFATAGAFIGNLFIAAINLVIDIFVVLWNFIAAFANFFANVFNDPVGSIARLFFDLVDEILSLLQSLASAIDTIFGSNLAGAVSGWRDSLDGWVDSTFGKGKEVMKKVNAEDWHISLWGKDRFSYGDAYNAGYDFGKGIEEKFDPSNLFNTAEIPGAVNYPTSAGDYASAMSNINDGVGDIAGNTKDIADSMDITKEELKYLRDIAERDVVNRITAASIKVEMTNNNTVSSDLDLDGITEHLRSAIEEQMNAAAEGVH